MATVKQKALQRDQSRDIRVEHPPSSMESLQTRVDSFSKAKRVKNPAKPSSLVSLKWPHPRAPQYLATPETLAEAGFYFNPSFDDRDNVTCFMCEKQLSDWEAHDDPFDIHWNKCGDNCCWAIVRCGLREDLDGHGGFVFSDKSRLPTSKLMERARLETFSAGDGWIHDQEKNHGANSRKMARAGFVFTPQHVGDDLATCLYCHVALSGWDADDDPTEEHRKRANRAGSSCPMFVLPEAPSKPPSRSQSQSQPKPASKSQPPKHSRSMSSSKHNDLVLPMKTHDGDGDNSDAPPTSSSRRSGGKGRSASDTSKGAKTPKKLTRSQSRSELEDVAEDDEAAEEDEEEQEDATAPPGRTGKAKAKKSIVPKQKTRSRSKSVARSAADLFDDDEEVGVKEKTTSRSRSKAKEPPGDEEDVAKVLKKSTRGKVASRIEEPEEEDVATTLKKSTRGRTPSRVAEPEEGVPEVKTLKKSTRGKILPPATEDEAEEVAKVLKSTKGRPPSSVEEELEDVVPRKPSRAKKNKAPSVLEAKPEPEPGPSVEEAAEDEGRKPRQPSKGKARAPVARKPSRPRSKVIPVSEEIAAEEDERQAEVAPPPGVDKKKRVPPASAATKVKATPPPLTTKERSKAPSAKAEDEEQEVDEIMRDDAPADEDHGVDAFDSPRASPVPQLAPLQAKHKQQEEEEPRVNTRKVDEMKLEPLSVPKRAVKPSPIAKVMDMDVDMEGVGNGGSQPELTNKPENNRKPSSAQGLAKERKLTKEQVDMAATGKARKASSLKVVEISTDEEGDGDDDGCNDERPKVQDDQPLPKTRQPTDAPLPKEKVTQKPLPQVYVEITQPPKLAKPKPAASRPQSPPQLPRVDASGDVEMANAEPEAPAQEAEDEHMTPPRPALPPAAPVLNGNSEPAPQTLLIPALSKLPFTALQNLTDAELDMTVEEWIRYQMEVEYDKFRRDGERELGRFKKRAEEVRGVIERL